MESLTRATAMEVIEEIRTENGGISAEDRAKTPAAVLMSLSKVRRKLGSATKTLATNLYSKNTRFVYELIQNAEDNNYTRAKEPFLSFAIYPDRIIVDSNEDGFSSDNVRAICSTGESTKTGMQGYIGEKGIGFKSVFKVAKKVHVQSEPFSFAFEHTKESDDDGLGMVTPMDEDFEDLPLGVQTRITLILKDFPMTPEQCDDLFNIPDTLLLFLGKLKRLQVSRHLPGIDNSSTTYQYCFDSEKDLAMITKEVSCGSESRSTSSLFRVFKRDVSGLPSDDARSYTDRATVVLAFPVDNAEEPVIQDQHVFAFLPLRKVGFKFLIQADFITQASREDIFDSERNRQLLDEVAEAFCGAVKKFCRSPSLVHRWIKYLPEDTISDGFWKRLRATLISRLAAMPIIRPWSESRLYKPAELRILLPQLLASDGQPLFKDLEIETYLSPRYDKDDLHKLQALGVKRSMTRNEILDRVEADLRSITSRLKGGDLNGDWHDRAAKLLVVVFEESDEATRNRMRRLSFIPLTDSSWISAERKQIYFSKSGESEIPRDLGFNLVAPHATRNWSRVQLLRSLGVTDCSPESVISLIYQLYRPFRSGFGEIKSHKPYEHLLFLFKNLPKATAETSPEISVLSTHNKAVWLVGEKKQRMYFREPNNPYGPGQLFESGSNGNTVDGVHCLHPDIADYPCETIRFGRSFNVWLEEVVGVQRIPQLVHHSEGRLSNELSYLMKHRPETLLGLLKQHWPLYKAQVSKFGIREALQNCKMPSEAAATSVTLNGSYIPLPTLRDILAHSRIAANSLFLKMPNQLRDQDVSEWEFLRDLGVGVRDDLRFYLAALCRQACVFGSICTEGDLGLYHQIAKNCSTPEDSELVQSEFDKNLLICVPTSTKREPFEWIRPNDCVWDGPSWLTTKKSLRARYQTLEEFFRITLKVRVFAWRDCLAELESMKRKQGRDQKKVSEIYRWLMQDFRHADNWVKLRSEFEERELVLEPTKRTWHPPSSCVWAEHRICIPQKQSIFTSDPELQDFFTRMLGIPRPNLRMHVERLKELAIDKTRDSEREHWLGRVKEVMTLISSMNPEKEDMSQIRSVNIFPVRKADGTVQLTSSRVEFAIVDRTDFQDLFSGITTSEFSLEEVHRLQPFLRAMDLEKNHMSRLINEETTVNGGVANQFLTEFLRSRAYALFRCAVYYHSPKARDGDKSLFDQLQRSKTLTSDSISKSMHIIQNSQKYVVERQKANFHLDDADEGLHLYVPKNKRDREVSYFRQLPRRLLQFLAISDQTAEAVVGNIVNSSRLSVVDEILADAGVIEVPGIDRPPELDPDDAPTSDEGALTPAETASTTSDQTPERPSVSPEKSYVTASSTFGSREPFLAVACRSIHVARSPSPAPILPPENKYASLLNRVITAAAGMVLPKKGSCAFSCASIDHTTAIESIFGYRSPERDRMVGAAGELLVFELLSKMSKMYLPGFGLRNWASTIRKEVKAHDKYRDLEPWNGSETTDITYDDVSSEFTNLLNEYGYFDKSTIVSQPECYIEVKTTTGNWDEPFFVSRRQYDRMQNIHRVFGFGAKKATYIIMRVFNLERDKIGLRIYDDPIAAKERGELHFEVDTWRVTPH